MPKSLILCAGRQTPRIKSDLSLIHILRRMRQNRADEKATFELCEKRIAAHKLQMKLVDAEYTLDPTRFTVMMKQEFCSTTAEEHKFPMLW